MSEFVRIRVGDSRSYADLDQRLLVQHSRNFVGSFYEAVAANICGAVQWEAGEICSQDGDSLIPDLLRRQDACFVEVKGGNKNSQFKIYEWQIELYRRIHQSMRFPVYRPRIEYAIFVHSLKDITKKLKTPRRLIEALAQNTLFGVVIDLEILLKMRNSIGTLSYGYNGKRGYYPSFVPITTRHLRQLTEFPQNYLMSLGLNPERFSFRKICFGKGVSVNDQQVLPFDVFVCSKRRHQRFGYNGSVDQSLVTGTSQIELFSRESDCLQTMSEDTAWKQGDDVPF